MYLFIYLYSILQETYRIFIGEIRFNLLEPEFYI